MTALYLTARRAPRRQHSRGETATCAVLILLLTGPLTGMTGPTPAPLPDHPGNVFLVGEEVMVRPAAGGGEWTLEDYDGQKRTVQATDGVIRLGRLPVGFYRLRQPGQAAWTSMAVLQPLAAPTPSNSPVALDVAMAWFYSKEKMDAAASLCALAGVNWVRDRLAWGQMEPSRGEWAAENRYDHSARAQSRAGLRVLQVNHSSPRWANPDGKRFPLDLRDAYRFHREMARRWRGQVLAFEPWNEADITVFGGHTGAEMASMQKASYLGLKAGNPEVIACLNVFASHNRAQLEDLHDNQAWPWFDTFNLHHYEPFDSYPRLYADFREFSAGRPLWVTECAVPVKWAGDEKLQEPAEADLKVQAERIAKVFACSLHEGSAQVFYFLLPHYVEGQTQFGILRPDLTPRPAYVALAAVGRLLAEARPLGRLQTTNAALRAYLFQARPDGRSRRVLVAWSTEGQHSLKLPRVPQAVADHLGRAAAASAELTVDTAPRFAIFDADIQRAMDLVPPPSTPPVLEGRPTPLVLQALWPTDQVELKRSAYRVELAQRATIPVFLYNFGETPATGTLRLEAPDAWDARIEGSVRVAPMEKAELRLELQPRNLAPGTVGRVRLVGDFGPTGQTVLSLRLTADPRGLLREAGRPIQGLTNTSAWSAMISGPGALMLSNRQGELRVEARPAGSDRWVYPRLNLEPADRPVSTTLGLACTITVEEGDGQFRAIFDEAGGSGYVVDLAPQPARGRSVEVMALFENATFGHGWSKPDPNGKLDASEIVTFKIGCNTSSSNVTYRIGRLRWLIP